jgi:hypothetical protein
MLAHWQLLPVSLPRWKPLCVSCLFSGDRMRPWGFESEFAGSFLGGSFGRRFDYSA